MYNDNDDDDEDDDDDNNNNNNNQRQKGIFLLYPHALSHCTGRMSWLFYPFYSVLIENTNEAKSISFKMGGLRCMQE